MLPSRSYCYYTYLVTLPDTLSVEEIKKIKGLLGKFLGAFAGTVILKPAGETAFKVVSKKDLSFLAEIIELISGKILLPPFSKTSGIKDA